MSNCSYCDKDITKQLALGTTECPFCFTAIDDALIGSEQQPGQVFAITLKRLNGNGTIQIHATDSPVELGRSHHGAELLTGIHYVSRNHCTIYLETDGCFVTDNGSTNGTFIGSKKIDCQKFPRQRLNQHEILYLGQEAFQVVLEYAKDPDSKETEQPAPVQAGAATFTCVSCFGFESDVREFVCPKCNAYNN